MAAGAEGQELPRLGATSSGARQASCIRGGSTRTQTKQAANGDGERDTVEVWAWAARARSRASFRGRWGACEISQQAAPDCRFVLAGRQTRECRQASAEAAGDMALRCICVMDVVMYCTVLCMRAGR